MIINIDRYQSEYKEYCDIFWKSVTTEEVYSEITQGDQDYDQYINLCKRRLFSFKDWMGHSYPEIATSNLPISEEDKYW